MTASRSRSDGYGSCSVRFPRPKRWASACVALPRLVFTLDLLPETAGARVSGGVTELRQAVGLPEADAMIVSSPRQMSFRRDNEGCCGCLGPTPLLRHTGYGR